MYTTALRRRLQSMWLSKDFPLLAKIGMKLLSMHTTACAAERNWSKWGMMFAKNRPRLGRQRALKMIFLMENYSVGEEPEFDMLDLCG